ENTTCLLIAVYSVFQIIYQIINNIKILENGVFPFINALILIFFVLCLLISIICLVSMNRRGFLISLLILNIVLIIIILISNLRSLISILSMLDVSFNDSAFVASLFINLLNFPLVFTLSFTIICVKFA